MHLKTLTFIHAFLVIGLLALGTFTYFFGVGFVGQFNVTGDILIYLVPLVAMLGYFGSKMLFNKQLKTIEKTDLLQTKLAKYQTASILKYALIEGPAVLAFIIFMSNGYTLYFSIAVCLVVYLAVQRPTKEKLIQDLGLSASEQREL